MAAYSGDAAATACLLKYGSDPNLECEAYHYLFSVFGGLADTTANTKFVAGPIRPRHIAARFGHTDVVKALLQGGVDVNKYCSATHRERQVDGQYGHERGHKFTALHLAVLHGHHDSVEALCAASSVCMDVCAFDDRYELCMAIDNKDLRMVEILIAAGARASVSMERAIRRVPVYNNYDSQVIESVIYAVNLLQSHGTAFPWDRLPGYLPGHALDAHFTVVWCCCPNELPRFFQKYHYTGIRAISPDLAPESKALVRTVLLLLNRGLPGGEGIDPLREEIFKLIFGKEE